MKRGLPFELTPELAHAHAGGLLAIDPAALGGAFALPEDAPVPAEPQAVAKVFVEGPLSQRGTANMCGWSDGYDTIVERFRAAMEHPQVSAVVLVIDSPGGALAGCWEGVRRMCEIRDRAGKKVYAYADEMIASAAYALATVADGGIYLPSSGTVGSVGVVQIHMDHSQALAKDGVRATVIRSGPRKMEGNPYEPLSDAAALAMQAEVDRQANAFFERVATARGLGVDAVRAFGGACFVGQSAVDVGLANGIASLEQVFEMAAGGRKELGMNEDEKKDFEALKARLKAAEDELAKLKAEDDDAPKDDDAEPSAEDDDAPTDDEPKDEDAKAKASAASPVAMAVELQKAKAELAKLKASDEKGKLLASRTDIAPTVRGWLKEQPLATVREFLAATPGDGSTQRAAARGETQGTSKSPAQSAVDADVDKALNIRRHPAGTVGFLSPESGLRQFVTVTPEEAKRLKKGA